jgi:hypothetical protein
VSLIGIEWLRSSPLLFYLNGDFVGAFKSRFPDARLYGSFFVSGMTSTTYLPPEPDIYLLANLDLSYFPRKAKLNLGRAKLVVDKVTGTRSYYERDIIEFEMSKDDFKNLMNKEISQNFFDNYFLARNKINETELPVLKESIKTIFELKNSGSRVIDITLSPARSGSFTSSTDASSVACDKLYDVTIKYKLNNSVKEVREQYGKSGDVWIH